MQAHLPSGLPDLLPPVAAQEFRAIHQLLKRFTAYGYAPVIPPMAEYESSLLEGQGAATARQVFRVMDPISREMLGLRADITTQVARIATQGLKDAARPLRLCYAGYTLRTTPESLHTRRQHTQIGIELFGATAPSHDAEVIAVACDALAALNLTDLSLDLSAPALFASLLQTIPEASRSQAKEATSRKDAASLRALRATLLADIVETSGPADAALPKLQALAKTNPSLKAPLDAIIAIIDALRAKGIAVPVTLDLLEPSGFGYYSGIACSLFLRSPALEIGRGGHYTNKDGEDASGFTFYIDDVLTALGTGETAERIGVVANTPLDSLREWQNKGYETVLLHSKDTTMEARQLGCSYLLVKNEIKRIEQ